MGPRREQDIFTATLELLVEHGYDKLAIESVAARSGVNKTTIYRWWASKDELLAAALLKSPLLEFAMPDTGSLRDDLIALGVQIARLLSTSPTADIAAAALTAVPGRPALGQVAEAFFTDRLVREQPMFARAVKRGELGADVDPGSIVDVLAGALWFRILLRSRKASRSFVVSLVDGLLTGLA